MLGNGVRCTTTSTGTGSLTLSSVSGYPQFSDVFAVGAYVYYAILNDGDGTPIEWGIGHLSASTTFVRDFVLATYSSSVYSDAGSAGSPPSAVSLAAGTKRVICTMDQSAAIAGPLDIPLISSGRKTIHPDGNPPPLSASTLVVTTDRCYYQPILVRTPRQFKALTCRVSGVVASTKARMGLYAPTLNGLPGAKLYETADIDTTTSGAKATSITQHRPRPGLLWIALACNGAVTFNANTISACFGGLLGTDSTMVQSTNCFYEALTGGWSALPSTASASLTALASGAIPTVGIEVI